eukprot:1369937-Heterocapsa_arctica.AAC.1
MLASPASSGRSCSLISHPFGGRPHGLLPSTVGLPTSNCWSFVGISCGPSCDARGSTGWLRIRSRGVSVLALRWAPGRRLLPLLRRSSSSPATFELGTGSGAWVLSLGRPL